MNITPKRTEIVMKKVEALMDEGEMDRCAEYGETGYDQSEKGIYFSDWNDKEFLADYLEALGYDIEWQDEWHIDYDNGKAWRTVGNSYHWVCAVAFDGENSRILTPDDDVSDWVDYAENQTDVALPDWVTEESMTELGFVKTDDDYAHGLYNRADKPSDIASQLKANGVESFVFQIDGSNQFETQFSVFVKQ